MRIALVSPYDLSVPGGVQNQVVGLASVLQAADHQVLLVAPGEAPAELAHDIAFSRAGRTITVAVNGSRAPIAPFPSAALQARRALRDFVPDVVHVHEPFVPGAAMAATFWTGPTVGTFHRSGVSSTYRALGPILARIARRIDRSVVVSDAAAATISQVIGAPETPWPVLANGVDVGRFAAQAPRKHDLETIVFLGRHEERKGLAVLLEAFQQMAAPARLRIIGDGPTGLALRRATASNPAVVWCGVLSDREVAQELAGADLFVAPSLSGESFGVVLLEAMAAGLPVIASDLPGYRLAGGDVVHYVAPGQAADLCRAIEELLGNAARRAQAVTAGHERADHFSFQQLAEQYLRIYQELCRVLPT